MHWAFLRVINNKSEMSEWKVGYLRRVNTREHLTRLLPFVASLSSDLTTLGVAEQYYELEVSSATRQWTVLKEEEEIIKFLRELRHEYRISVSLVDFLNSKFSLSSLGGSNGIKYESGNDSFCKEFFEIDFVQFNKVKSLKMYKKGGGRFSQYCICQANWLQWKKRDFIITLDGVLYCDSDHTIKQFIPFGRSFSFKLNYDADLEYKTKLRSNHRILSIRAEDLRNYFTFHFYLDKALKEARHIFQFDSFAPMRMHNHLQFLVDGEKYFGKVAGIMQGAKEEVLISGWWVSPEFHLVRPCEGNNLKYRLDHLIERLAKRGVKVYILVYWESTFVSNESIHTEKIFKRMGPNVKIIRHPDIVLPSFWSHHEKIIIVDQKIAFLGGLDLCYGRYDSSCHSVSETSEKLYPGIEYNNTRKKDFTAVKKIDVPAIDRTLPRLPWHDVAVMLQGPCVKDVCYHFIEYWNFASFQIHNVKRSVLVVDSSKSSHELHRRQRFVQYVTEKWGKISTIFKKERKERHIDKMESEGQLNKHSMMETDKESMGHHPKSTIVKVKQKKPQEKVQVENRHSEIINTASRSQKRLSFLEEEEEEKFRKQLESRRKDKNLERLNELIQKNDLGKDNVEDYMSERFSSDEYLESSDGSHGFHCQILRSASQWSIGCQEGNFEASIYSAYLDLIAKAKKFIYIENQFFISSVKENDVVENKIGDALYDRIAKAIQEKQPFSVIVIMPLVPGFAGQLDHSDATVALDIMHWQYRTILRNKNSLLEKLKKITPDPDEYITFLGLRNHGKIGGRPVTEIIYLHSKLMIVDDCRAILGSANINDRSMSGDRDSEICILIQNNEDLLVKFGQEKYKVNSAIHQLRLGLWKEHFNLETSELLDPLNKNLREKIKQRVKNNVEIYRKIFRCYPDDTVKKRKDIAEFQAGAQLELYDKQSPKITCNAVEFPLLFLERDKLASFHPNQITT